MIPREAKRGGSFKGAGLYYLHDKGAQTKERVAFTHTENLPTDDAEDGLRVMACTAMNADNLKRKAGVARSGRKASKEVYCFSLSWHPEEKPERGHMLETGRAALAALGLQEHETVMVAHNDEAYSHLHLIVNLVNPDHGKMHTLQYSRKRLSTWAEAYEREHSQKIYCEQRVKNNQRRKEGEYVKYQDPELDQKTIITKLYQASDSGKALQAALAEAGFTICQGRRIVLVDKVGEIHSLSRQLEGVREKDVRALLADMVLPEVDDVRKRQEEERGKQEAQKTTAIKGKKQKEQVRDEQPADQPGDQSGGRREDGETRPPTRVASSSPSLSGAQPTPTETRNVTPHHSVLNRMQNRQRDELLEFSWEQASAARSQLARELDQRYGKDEWRLQKEMMLLAQTLKERGKLSEEEADRLDTLRHDLAQIEARKATATQALNERLKGQEDAIKTRHTQERTTVYHGGDLPKTARDKEFEKAASVPLNVPIGRELTEDERARNAFLDRVQGQRGNTLTQEWQSLQPRPQRRELTPEFAAAVEDQTPDDAARNAFLHRMESDDYEREVVPVTTTPPQVEDEYATSLSAEFEAAGGDGYAADAGRDAFLDRMGGGGLEQGISLGRE